MRRDALVNTRACELSGRASLNTTRMRLGALVNTRAWCSRSAVVSIFQKWLKEGTVVNRQQGHGRPRLTDARGERRLARVVRSNRRATVAQVAQEVNAGSDRKVSEYTVPMLTPVHRRKCQQWAREHQNWTTEQWKKVAWSAESHFLFCVAYLGNTWHQDALWEEGKPAEGG
ncbi:hypothetical protein DPX16_20448 [Anabarilius grahami]|uniref:Transposase Tc1-like domain-containing protein n=1 Tax=Anabarilius grahami TaxID=495550 RepID=A0A3N0Z5W6_ANAGA|nr:hypothetical protein DPX16_20448 [Anabarilius grahami]